MTATTWELNLKGNAPTAAKRAAREVAALVKVLRDLKDVAPLASRALDGVAGPSTIRNLRTQVGLTRELGRELRKNNTESRRANRPAGGGAVNRGRTRVEGFTPGELARMETMNRRRRERDAAADVAGGRRASQRMQQSFRENDRLRRQNDRAAERGNYSYFQRQSRMAQQSFRENDRIHAEQQRGQQREAALASRALVRRNASADASPIGFALESLIGRGGIAALGYAAAGAAALMGAIYALGSAMVSITQTTIEIAGQIAGLIAEFAQLAFSLGGAILQMISFRESTLMTLSTLMRVAGEDRMTAQQRQTARGDAAQGEFRWAQQFGRETPLSTQQVVELRTQASTAGYQGAEARTMTAAAADAGALHPNDAGTASRFMLQMGQLKNSSVARSADYRPAAQAAGVSETAAMRRAAIAAGIVQRSGENETAYQRRIRTAQGNGSITGRQMHDAILEEQRSQLGSRNSGDFARSQSGSMAAVLSNLGEGAQAFVTSIQDIERLPGIVMLKSMLTDITSMLAGTTNNGKALQAVFAQLVNESASFVANIFGKGGFDGALSSAMDAVKAILPPLRAIWQGFSGGFMEGFMPFIRALGGFDDLVGTLRTLGPQAREMGAAVAQIAIFMIQVSALTLRWTADLIRAGRIIPNLVYAFRMLWNMTFHPMDTLSDMLASSATRAARNTAGDFFGIGQNMGDGVAAGFRDRQAHMQAEISSVMASLPATARTDMQIKSPSRVMAEIGEYMADGVTVGLDSGAGGVRSAMSNVVAPPSLPGLGGGLGAMGGINVGGVVIHVNGAQDTAGVVDELRSKLEEFFVGLIERPALAGGA